MKKLQALGALLLATAPLGAAIDFGSQSSMLSASGGDLTLGTATLTGGTIALTGAGSVATDATSGATFNDVTYLVKSGTSTKSYTVDGTVVKLGASMTIGDNQELSVAGGQVAEDLTVSGVDATPSIISGYGSFDAGITLGGATNDADYEVVMRWDGPLNQNITMSHTATTKGDVKVTLEKDLEFISGKLIVADASATASIVDFNSHTLSMGGVTLSDSQTWNTARLNMIGDVTIAASKTITLGTAAAYFNGNSNKLVFDAASILANGGNAVTLSDIYLSGMTSASLAGTGDWTLLNTVIDSNSEALRFINGSLTSATVDIFGGAAEFGASSIELLTDVANGGDWTLGGALTLKGNGHKFTFSSGNDLINGGNAVTLSDITLADVTSTSLQGLGVWTMHNTTIQTSTDSLTVVDGSITSDPVDVFGANGVTFGASTIELNKDVAIGGTWTFGGNTTISGKGCVLDLTGGTVNFGTNTLSLRDMTVILDAASFANTAGTVSLANVTVIASAESINLSTTDITITVDGACTMVVGSSTFTAKAGSAISKDVTLFVDNLGSDGTVSGFTETAGRQATLNVLGGSVSLSTDGGLTENMYLYATDGSTASRTLTLNKGAAQAYDGHGRSLVFPATDGNSAGTTVFTVGDNTSVTLSNIVLDGLIPEEHLSVSGIGGALYFGDDSVIKLGDNSALNQTLTFGSSGAATGEEMILDLCGYTLDMANASALIALQGSATNILRIKNGTIVNFSGSKMTSEAGTVIEFEDVVISLSGDATFATGTSIDFYGQNVVTGEYGQAHELILSSIALNIKADARLTLLDDVVLRQTGTASIAPTDASSVLELIGATIVQTASASALEISAGTIVIDHKVTMTAVTGGGIYIEAATGSVNLIVRPGAKLIGSAETLSLVAAA